MYNPLFMGIVLIFISSCSQVQLSYQLPVSSLTQITSGEATRNQAASEIALARLTLNTTLNISTAELGGMRLKFVLAHDQETLQQLEFPAERFLSDSSLLWEALPLGNTRLEVTLIDVNGKVVSTLQKNFVLTEKGQQQVDFGLFRGVGATEGEMSLGYRSDLAESRTASLEQVRFALPLSSPGPLFPPFVNSTATNPVIGSTDSLKAPDLKLRLVESGQTNLLFIWEAPIGVEVSYYRLLLEGKVIEENYVSANYRVQNLLNNTRYRFSVQAVSKTGLIFPEQSLSATTGSGSSSGGGGGGGGGGTPPVVNNPPVIQSLIATRTTLPSPAYPVGLQASATDELLLSDAAYTWSCTDCADATFNTSTGTASSGVGKNVVWNAPSTPGSYTLTLSVSDGVNAPVTRNQVVVVNQRLGTVIVEGTYQ